MNDTIFEKRISYIISKHEQKKILPKDVLHNTAEQNSLTIKGGTYLYQIPYSRDYLLPAVLLQPWNFLGQFLLSKKCGLLRVLFKSG